MKDYTQPLLSPYVHVKHEDAPTLVGSNAAAVTQFTAEEGSFSELY